MQRRARQQATAAATFCVHHGIAKAFTRVARDNGEHKPRQPTCQVQTLVCRHRKPSAVAWCCAADLCRQYSVRVLFDCRVSLSNPTFARGALVWLRYTQTRQSQLVSIATASCSVLQHMVSMLKSTGSLLCAAMLQVSSGDEVHIA